MIKKHLNKEDKEWLKLAEVPDVKRVDQYDKEIKRYKSIAAESLKKTARLNIRIAPYDLQSIKSKAVGEGLPYQTLIASIIHKYATGQLIAR